MYISGFRMRAQKPHQPGHHSINLFLYISVKLEEVNNKKKRWPNSTLVMEYHGMI
jgi:hypothetical protein